MEVFLQHSNIKTLLFLGYSKLFIGPGFNAGEYFNTVEVIDLEYSSTSCQQLANYPHSVEGSIGGLDFSNNPLICGGKERPFAYYSDCFSYKQNQWVASKKMNVARAYSTVSPSPYPDKPSKLFITGGINENEGPKMAEVLTEKGWETVLPVGLPNKIVGHCMVLINATTVLAIGGFQNGLEFSCSQAIMYSTSRTLMAK